MEFIEGETAEALIRRDGPCSVEIALRVARQVARALAAAERHGIVHRDIKPANLMVAFDHSDADEGFLVKVIDFGMACWPHAPETAEAGFCGTAQYASPEQAEEAEVDGRSDIYSLGCTLWFLLTGSPPFTGSLANILVQRLHGEPPWEKLKSFPPAVTGLLRILLRRNRDERPRNATEVQRAIEMCLAAVQKAQTVRARVAHSFNVPRRWFVGHPGRQYAAVIVAALLVSCAVLIQNSWISSDQLRDTEPVNVAAPPPVAEAPPAPAKVAPANSPLVPVAHNLDPVGAGQGPAADQREPNEDTIADEEFISHHPSASSPPEIASADDPDDSPESAAMPEKPEPKGKPVAKNSRSKRSHRSTSPQRSSNPFVRINRTIRGLVGRLF